MRKSYYALLTAISLAMPVQAQDTTVEDSTEMEEGFDLMEEGAKLLLRGLLNEMEPALDDFEELAEGMIRDFGPAMQEFAEQMEEGLAEVLTLIDNIRYYENPEILPNGDIIIRRREDAPEYVPPGDEIEL